MPRPFDGIEHLAAAQAQCRQAKSAQQLRQALAVLLPLAHGYTLEQTAQIVGRSCGETSRLRNAFIAEQEGRQPARQSTSYRRAEQHQRQGAALDELLPLAAEGGVVVIPQLKPLLEQKLGRSLCLASVYNLLHRHGWRKLAPDTVHPQGNPSAREDWKKNCNNRWQKSKRSL